MIVLRAQRAGSEIEVSIDCTGHAPWPDGAHALARANLRLIEGDLIDQLDAIMSCLAELQHQIKTDEVWVSDDCAL
jgi:hypothetical protein